MTKEQWKGLHEKARWDIIVALRGPDMINGELFKWFTTGVIRGQVWSLVKPSGGSATKNMVLPGIVLPSGSLNFAQKFGSFDANHFLGHVKLAATHIGLPVYYVPKEKYLEAIQMGGEYTAMKYWLSLPEDGLPTATREMLKKVCEQ